MPCLGEVHIVERTFGNRFMWPLGSNDMGEYYLQDVKAYAAATDKG